MPLFENYKKIHFTGIGGIGMSGIAELLLRLGYKISGSDRALSDITERLSGLGAEIYEGHKAENVKDVDLLVYTSAVGKDNPEVSFAFEKGITAVKRSDMLGELMRMHHYGIGIAGTHGKSSTTGMISKILIEAELDPSVIIGAKVDFLGNANSRFGNKEFIIVESDEYDRTFLKLKPAAIAVTNVELEHLDIYSDLEDINNTFVAFINSIPFYGFSFLCADEENLMSLLPRITTKYYTYGVENNADLMAKNIAYKEYGSTFELWFENSLLGKVRLNVPGKHNVKNALAALGLAIKLNIKPNVAIEALGKYYGIDRRFQVKYDEKILYIDDYAHHPTEVAASLSAIKSGWNRRLIVAFQPHLFTRTRDFYKEFAAALSVADVVLVADVYPAREPAIEGVSGKLITDVLSEKYQHQNVYFMAEKEKIGAFLTDLAQEGDIVITMGAGDINKQGEIFINAIKYVQK